ncbi:MAG: hypothetical protein H7210_05865, partial [Pyrinomonadaceae bacterium]|nr:hypothetical protein [Phycisphaerales bacterium]
MVNVAGEVATLSSLVQTLEGQGPADYRNLHVAKVGSNGHILLSQGSPLTPSDTPALTWVYSNGVLTHLWNGFVYDVNSTGTVVGELVTDDVLPQAVIWSHQSGIVIIPELTGSLLVNDNGVVVGTRTGTRTPTSPGTIATWLNGVVTNVVDGPQFPVNSFRPNVWTFRAIDDTGRILVDASAYEANGPSRAFTTYIYEPSTGLRTLRDATHRLGDPLFGTVPNVSGPGPNEAIQTPMAFAADGRILSYNRILNQVDDSAVGVIREGSPVQTISVTGVGNFITAINQYDELVLFTLNGSSSTVRRLTDQLITAGNDNVAIFQNPRFTNPDGTASAFVALANGGGLQIFSLVADQPNDGRFLSVNFRDTAIVSNLTVFINSEGIPHLAGFDAAGDLVINYWAAFSQDAGDWRFDNLTVGHFTPAGIETPTIVSHLTAYSTSWGGMNIAGLDADGHVQVAWWAPGEMPWKLADISMAAGTTPVTFHGEITAFVTAWGTMHVNGTSNDLNQPASLWWAPGDGTQWRSSTLSLFGIGVDPDAFTSFITPWGGLNVASLDDTGHLAVYWWAPSTGVWTPQVIQVQGAQSPVLTGRLSSNVEVTDETVTQSVVALGEDGSLYRFSWSVGDTLWMLENVSEQIR